MYLKNKFDIPEYDVVKWLLYFYYYRGWKGCVCSYLDDYTMDVAI
jgi:hypothetical protein